jgi:hypothetical protein
MIAAWISSLLGMWLMVAPAIFAYAETAAGMNGRIIGPIVAALSIIACFEVTRIVRVCTRPLALWLVVAPWILGYDSGAAIAVELTSGVLLLGLSFVPGRMKEQYGGGWESLWSSDRQADGK